MNNYASLPTVLIVLNKRRRRIRTLPCLRCGQPFKSFGPGNRVCDRCRKENTKIDWSYARLLA
jgi:hypothetical protein